jgi:hypothetical protein
MQLLTSTSYSPKIRTDDTAEELSDSREKQELHLFLKASGSAPDPTHPSTELLMGTFATE